MTAASIPRATTLTMREIKLSASCSRTTAHVISAMTVTADYKPLQLLSKALRATPTTVMTGCKRLRMLGALRGALFTTLEDSSRISITEYPEVLSRRLMLRLTMMRPEIACG